ADDSRSAAPGPFAGPSKRTPFHTRRPSPRAARGRFRSSLGAHRPAPAASPIDVVERTRQRAHAVQVERLRAQPRIDARRLERAPGALPAVHGGEAVREGLAAVAEG